MAYFNVPVQNGLYFLRVSAQVEESNNKIFALHWEFFVVILGKTKQNKNNNAEVEHFTMLHQWTYQGLDSL